MRFPKIKLPRLGQPRIVRAVGVLAWLPKRPTDRTDRSVRHPHNAVLIGLAALIVVSGLIWLNNRTGVFGAMVLASPSFKDGDQLPRQFTCEGEDIIPEFAIRNIPNKARSLAIIIEDLDINKRDYKDYPHLAQMIIWNIPASTTKITRGVRPPGTIGRNLLGNFAYNGPCPPQGQTHRYRFTLYALRQDSLSISPEAGLVAVKKAISKADIAVSKLTASYTGTNLLP